jgi:hypothetical protein
VIGIVGEPVWYMAISTDLMFELGMRPKYCNVISVNRQFDKEET